MTSAETRSESLTAARSLTDIARQLADSAVASAARLTNGGKEIDAHQAHVSRLAQIAIEAQAAAELTAYAESRADAGAADDLTDEQALIFAAEALHKEARANNVRVSRATIYNTLNQFTEAGMLREVVVDASHSYFDTNVSHHHHFFCEEDRYLVDIPGEELKVAKLPHPPPGTTVTEVDIVIRVRKNPGLEG